ncbi:ATP-binding protein [Spirillospora sp. NPDC047279]|uniref:AlbA family DNA-binding domain-containing protein n=1 Tax=Spirillospora sp. NPDC047279 TaxID=3155478 RepID=UPI0033E35AE7
MSLLQALLHAAPSQVTIEQIRRLVSLVGPEAPMLEYKANMTSTIAKAVAALANTYGGLVLVGVTDDREITGVKEKTIEAVSQHCHSVLEPPWVPEVLPVPMDDGSGKYVLVLRVVPGIAPRPLLLDGAAPIRHNNTTHPATRQQLAALFAEQDTLAQADPWVIRAPKQPGHDDHVDLIARSGLNIDIDPRASWRPLREQYVDQLATALNRSPLINALTALALPAEGLTARPFHRRGLNRSRVITLLWQALPQGWTPHDLAPVEATFSMEVPGGYGQHARHMRAHLDVILRVGHWRTPALRKALRREISRSPLAPVAHDPSPRLPDPGESEVDWRMSVPDLRRLIEALMAALVDEHVVRALAQLAQVQPLVVPQPQVLHLTSRRPMPETLDTEGLEAIPEIRDSSGNSYGAHLLADPGLDLAAIGSRREQVNTWLVQTALDAGLLGMEKLLATR